MTAGRKIVADNKDWCTPAKYVDAVRHFFGGFIDLDPCSNKFSIVHARVEYSLPTQDGLRESWDYPTIYVNPPYGLDRVHGRGIKDWLRKCQQANEAHKSEVLALVPVATNTSHWKNYIFGKAMAVCFLYDTRLRFLVNGQDGGKGAPMSCAMIYWGTNYRRFFEVFTRFGAVVNLEPLKNVRIGRESDSRNQEQFEFEGLLV